MLGDQPLEFGNDVGVATEGQVGVDALLESVGVAFLEPDDLGPRECLVGDVRQSWPAPECERLAQPGGGVGGPFARKRLAALVHEPLETLHVQLAVLHLKHVAVVARLEPLPLAVVERATQLADVVLENLRRRGRRRLAPQGIDQPIARNRLVAMQQQQDENDALPALSDRKGVIAVADLERSQQAKQHAQTS